MNELPHLIQRSNNIYYMTVTYDGSYVSGNGHFLERFDCYGLVDGSLQVKDTVVEEDWNKVQSSFNLSMETPGVPQSVTIRKPIPSGDVVYTSWEFISDHERQEIDCVGFDISARVSLSKKVLEFAGRINEIVDSITDGFYSLDRDWNFVLVNQAFLDIVFKTRKDIIGKSLWDIFPDDAGYNYPAKYRQAMNEGVAQRFEDYRPDIGRWFWAAAYPSEEGLIVFFKDITDRKKERSELIESKNKLSAILNSTSDTHILIAPDYTVLSFNKTAFDGLQKYFNLEITKGSSILNFTMPHTVDQFKECFKKAISGETVTLERSIEFPNNETRWVRMEYSPALNNSDEIIGVVVNSVDINELKEYELSLEKSNMQLREIAFKQSHEMRSPIARIIGLITLLKESPGDIEVMSHISEVAKELDVIIHDIIDRTEET